MEYIKVQREGEDNFTIVPKVNEGFYQKQGFNVSKPTKKEIEAFFSIPEEEDVEKSEEYKKLVSELETVKGERDTLVKEKEELENKLKELTKKK